MCINNRDRIKDVVATSMDQYRCISTGIEINICSSYKCGPIQIYQLQGQNKICINNRDRIKYVSTTGTE